MGSLPWNVAFSLARVLTDFLLAVLAGVPLGLAMGYFRTADLLFTVSVSVLRVIPPLHGYQELHGIPRPDQHRRPLRHQGPASHQVDAFSAPVSHP